jgi:hypothetical protein
MADMFSKADRLTMCVSILMRINNAQSIQCDLSNVLLSHGGQKILRQKERGGKLRNLAQD